MFDVFGTPSSNWCHMVSLKCWWQATLFVVSEVIVSAFVLNKTLGRSLITKQFAEEDELLAKPFCLISRSWNLRREWTSPSGDRSSARPYQANTNSCNSLSKLALGVISLSSFPRQSCPFCVYSTWSLETKRAEPGAVRCKTKATRWGKSQMQRFVVPFDW